MAAAAVGGLDPGDPIVDRRPTRRRPTAPSAPRRDAADRRRHAPPDSVAGAGGAAVNVPSGVVEHPVLDVALVEDPPPPVVGATVTCSGRGPTTRYSTSPAPGHERHDRAVGEVSPHDCRRRPARRRRSRTEVQPGPNAPLVSGAAVAAASELYVRRTSSTAVQPGWARSRSSWTKLPLAAQMGRRRSPDVGGRPYIWVWPTVIGGGAPGRHPGATASATWIEAFDDRDQARAVARVGGDELVVDGPHVRLVGTPCRRAAVSTAGSVRGRRRSPGMRRATDAAGVRATPSWSTAGARSRRRRLTNSWRLAGTAEWCHSSVRLPCRSRPSWRTPGAVGVGTGWARVGGRRRRSGLSQTFSNTLLRVLVLVDRPGPSTRFCWSIASFHACAQPLASLRRPAITSSATLLVVRGSLNLSPYGPCHCVRAVLAPSPHASTSPGQVVGVRPQLAGEAQAPVPVELDVFVRSW